MIGLLAIERHLTWAAANENWSADVEVIHRAASPIDGDGIDPVDNEEFISCLEADLQTVIDHSPETVAETIIEETEHYLRMFDDLSKFDFEKTFSEAYQVLVDGALANEETREFLARGGAHGDDLADWFKPERELNVRAATPHSPLR
jgi:hypothetical protein